MEVTRHEIRRGFTVPTLDEVKLVLAHAICGNAKWDAVALRQGRVILSAEAFDEERHYALQARIDQVIAAMEESLQHGDYWFKRYQKPRNWVAIVRRIGDIFYVVPDAWAMNRFATFQSLSMLRLEAQFPQAEGLRPGDLVELNLGPVVDALRGTRLAQFTAAQLATTICRGMAYPGSSRPSAGGQVVLFLDALACVLLNISDDTVDFNEDWQQKEGEPGTIIVPLKWDTDTYEKQVAGSVHTPALRFTITGAVDQEILGPTAFYGINDTPGMPVVSTGHESYLLTLAADLETRLRTVSV